MKFNKGLRGRLSRSAAVGVTLAVAATTTSVLTGSTTAVSAPAGDCPAAVPVTELTDDQPVDVLTVTDGTTPESFTGKVLGVLDDGIAPGLDMILVDFKTVEPAPSTIIDEVGIWSGMSGSPVYAADGRLIGAVAYGLGVGPSTVAGVTPAADMHKLLNVTAGSGPLGSPAATPNKVQIPKATAREMVREGNATTAQVDEGLTRLRMPLGVSGLSQRRPLGRVAKMLGLDNVRLFRASAAPSAAGEDIAIVPGGNLAASMSYGDVSAVGVGTATAVCAKEVLAFGHPFNWTGPSTLTMHGADALLIQPDPTVAGFKVANPGNPNGTIDQDRLAALHGVLGRTPATTRVRSVVTAGNGAPRIGNTFISVPDAMPDLAALHMLANQDTVFDGFGKGSARVKWTVIGERKNGQPFRFSHADRYANNFDISFEPVFEVLDQLFQLHNNEFEAVKVTNINYESAMIRKVRSFNVNKLQRRKDGVWRSVNPNRRLVVRPGKVLRLRVTMGSFRNEVGSKVRRFQIRVPNAANRTRGALTISGGNSFFGFGFEEEFEDGFGSPSSGSFNDMIKKFANTPRNDVLTAQLVVFKFNGRIVTRQKKSSVGDVVDGGFQLPVVIRRR